MDRLYEDVIYFFPFIIFSGVACVTDIRYRRIPDWIVLSAVITLSVFRIFLSDDSEGRILPDILAGPVIFMAVRLFTKGKLGMGDVKFSALMGVFNGFPEWFFATAIASFLGLLFAVAGLITGKLNKKSRIPFAPFLTAGSMGAWFAGPFLLQKMAGYLS